MSIINTLRMGPQGPQGTRGERGFTGLPGMDYIIPLPTTIQYSTVLNITTKKRQCIDILLTGDTLISFNGGTDGYKTILRLRQDNIGGHSVLFDNSVRYSLDIPNFYTTKTPNKMDYVVLIYDKIELVYNFVSYNRGF